MELPINIVFSGVKCKFSYGVIPNWLILSFLAIALVAFNMYISATCTDCLFGSIISTGNRLAWIPLHQAMDPTFISMNLSLLTIQMLLMVGQRLKVDGCDHQSWPWQNHVRGFEIRLWTLYLPKLIRLHVNCYQYCIYMLVCLAPFH